MGRPVKHGTKWRIRWLGEDAHQPYHKDLVLDFAQSILLAYR